jgi:hypothetical protein
VLAICTATAMSTSSATLLQFYSYMLHNSQIVLWLWKRVPHKEKCRRRDSQPRQRLLWHESNCTARGHKRTNVSIFDADREREREKQYRTALLNTTVGGDGKTNCSQNEIHLLKMVTSIEEE